MYREMMQLKKHSAGDAQLQNSFFFSFYCI